MKKVKLILYTLVLTCVVSVVKAAPSYSFSVSKGTIENGGKVSASVTVRNTAAWNITITSAGATSGCTNSWADATSDGEDGAKTFTTTCKATSTGTISFSLSGDITSADGSNNTVSGNKEVSVVQATSKTTTKSNASTVNILSGLSVEDYEITPTFDPEILEYSVTVPSNVKTIKINATKKDDKSSVKGDGEVSLEDGNNRFEIVVTSESGATRTYVIIVNIEDTNPITVKIKGRTYTIVKDSKLLTAPEGYIEKKITIKGQEVPSFYNEKTNIMLVGLKDNQGNVALYIYDSKKETYNLFKELTSNISFVVLSPSNQLKGFDKTKNISINDMEVEVYYNDYFDKNNVLVYGMNTKTGKSDWYIYDTEEQTFQKYRSTLLDNLNKKNKLYLICIIFFAGLSFVMIIISLITSKKLKNQNNKLISIIEKQEIEKKKYSTDNKKNSKEKKDLSKKLKN